MGLSFGDIIVKAEGTINPKNELKKRAFDLAARLF
jgi:hypothetical protein